MAALDDDATRRAWRAYRRSGNAFLLAGFGLLVAGFALVDRPDESAGVAGVLAVAAFVVGVRSRWRSRKQRQLLRAQDWRPVTIEHRRRETTVWEAWRGYLWRRHLFCLRDGEKVAV